MTTTVIALPSSNGREWYVQINGTHIAGFDEPAKAWRVAAELARALREEGDDNAVAPVATLPDFTVQTAVEAEVEQTKDAWFDDNLGGAWDSWRIPAWCESLQSIAPTGEGTVPLDADQAMALVDCLACALDTAEDFGNEDPEPWGDPVVLRTALAQIESQCGIYAEFWGNPRTTGYSIRINMEGESGNYRVKWQGETLCLPATLNEARDAVMTHKEGQS